MLWSLYMITSGKKIFCEKYKGFSDGLSHSELFHPSKKLRNKEKCLQPGSVPSIINVEFREGMGLSLVKGISPCFLAFSRGGIIPNVTGHH